MITKSDQAKEANNLYASTCFSTNEAKLLSETGDNLVDSHVSFGLEAEFEGTIKIDSTI